VPRAAIAANFDKARNGSTCGVPKIISDCILFVDGSVELRYVERAQLGGGRRWRGTDLVAQSARASRANAVHFGQRHPQPLVLSKPDTHEADGHCAQDRASSRECKCRCNGCRNEYLEGMRQRIGRRTSCRDIKG
jgi:hypothetical protein